MPWWWIVCAFLEALSLVWTICPSRTRIVGDGKLRRPRSSSNAQNSTFLPSGMISLSLKKSRRKATSGRTLPGVSGLPSCGLSENSCGAWGRPVNGPTNIVPPASWSSSCVVAMMESSALQMPVGEQPVGIQAAVQRLGHLLVVVNGEHADARGREGVGRRLERQQDVDDFATVDED